MIIVLFQMNYLTFVKGAGLTALPSVKNSCCKIIVNEKYQI